VSDPATETVPRKRPWLAVVLTLVVPGLGHAYLRLWGRAVLWFVLVLGTVITLVPGWFRADSIGALVSIAEGLDLTASLALFGISVLCMIDAYMMTSRYNQQSRQQQPEETTSCPECGRELDGDLEFCHWCTARLGEDKPE
jgi:uncharacterized paraquat-inducible protein A